MARENRVVQVEVCGRPDPPAADRSDKADAERFRWLLDGRVGFLEEHDVCKFAPCDDAEKDQARLAIDAATHRDVGPCAFCDQDNNGVEEMRSPRGIYYVLCYSCGAQGTKADTIERAVETWQRCQLMPREGGGND